MAASSDTNTSSAALDAYQRGDYATARELWLPLAEAGDPEAQAWIGSLYAVACQGDGTT